MHEIKNIIVHCSDSLFGNVNAIRRWHEERGWDDCGYHFVILNGHIEPQFYLPTLDGSIECGRPMNGDNWLYGNEIGAQALGYNQNSIGICMIGTKTFTSDQQFSLLCLVKNIIKHYESQDLKVLGHYETESAHGKTCPNIDMNTFRELLIP